MPFIKEKFHVKQSIPAFLFIMRTFGLTQAQAQRLIGKGRLLVDGKSELSSGKKVKGEVEVVFFHPASRNYAPLFKSQNFMVFEKPSGVLVHPNKMTTSYSMLDEIRTFGGDDANAVHRIDMETSGVLLASCQKKAESYLKGLFEHRKIQKTYLAWVEGKITSAFEVDKSLLVNHDYSHTKHKVFISSKGKMAQTYFLPLAYDKRLDATLLACHPRTGRMHQIRVHLFHVKHPILGDPIYGTTFEIANRYLEQTLDLQDRIVHTGAPRLMLHAKSLEFDYGARFNIESKVDFEGQKQLIAPASKRRFNKAGLNHHNDSIIYETRR